MLFASGNHTSVLSFSFTPVKPFKLTVSIDRLSMTFKVDGNGKNYFRDDFLFCVSLPLNHTVQKSEDKNILIYLPLIRVFSLYHGTDSDNRGRSSFLQFVVGLFTCKCHWWCTWLLFTPKKDRNPPIASGRLTFWTLCFFPQRSVLIKTRQCQSFFLSLRGNIFRSLWRVKEWRHSGFPFSQASVVHNWLPYMC